MSGFGISSGAAVTTIESKGAASFVEGRRHPDLRSVEVQLKAHYKAFWKEP
jgi:hypothetical protein